MTGAEHYKEAEDTLEQVKAGEFAEEKTENLWVSMAQVHAILALVQATLVQFEKEDWEKPVETADVSPAYL